MKKIQTNQALSIIKYMRMIYMSPKTDPIIEIKV